jgi:AcrR family transcriptional regulator
MSDLTMSGLTSPHKRCYRRLPRATGSVRSGPGTPSTVAVLMPGNRASQPTTTPTKAQRTRDALRVAALRRFRETGFEGANVSDIAADVGVTERTFYRYFPTKDAVLLGDLEQTVTWFQAALDARPADEHIVDAVRAAAMSFSGDRRVVIETARLTDSYLTEARLTKATRQMQGVVARAIYERLQPTQDDLRSAVAAEVLSGAIFAAFAVWTRGPHKDDVDHLVAMVHEALELARPSTP